MNSLYNLLINGEWLPADAGERFEVANPATREVVAECAKAGVIDTQHALEAAQEASQGWREKSPPTIFGSSSISGARCSCPRCHWGIVQDDLHLHGRFPGQPFLGAVAPFLPQGKGRHRLLVVRCRRAHRIATRPRS